MKKLTDKKWMPFKLGDICTIAKGVRLTKAKMKTGKRPFIGATKSYNGITNWVSNTNDSLDKNVLGVNYNGSVGYAFYHSYECIFTDDVKRLHLKHYKDGKYVLQFLAVAIAKQAKSHDYGYKFNGERMERQNILLPTNECGEPDYVFMKNYVKEREKVLLTRYKAFIRKHKIPSTRRLERLSEVAWRDYFLTDIFPEIKRGKRLKTKDHIFGTLPYVSSSAMNNGIDDFVGNEKRVRIFEDCLTIANSGSVGSTFYHAYKFVASDHVTHLKRKGLSPFQYLFIAVMCSKLANKYNFNREISDKRIAREKITLPSKSDGSPDFEYMDAFGRLILRYQLQRYLSYRFEK